MLCNTGFAAWNCPGAYGEWHLEPTMPLHAQPQREALTRTEFFDRNPHLLVLAICFWVLLPLLIIASAKEDNNNYY